MANSDKMAHFLDESSGAKLIDASEESDVSSSAQPGGILARNVAAMSTMVTSSFSTQDPDNHQLHTESLHSFISFDCSILSTTPLMTGLYWIT